MSEHSQLPWHDDGFSIKDADGNAVCIHGHHSKEPANRRLIVTAVNSHAELLAVAKQALEAIDSGNEILAAGIALEAAIAAEENAK
jgi:hypothetical protein